MGKACSKHEKMQNTNENFTKEIKNEEIKIDIPSEQNIIADSEGLMSIKSIYGKGGKPNKTVIIQKSPPQNSKINSNKYPSKDNFHSLSPFVTFPNINNKTLCSGPTSNAFFDAFFLAYVLHGEIVLSPDDIWLQINSCFGEYINKHSEALRNKMVSFENKKDLIVKYDETDPKFQDIKSKSFRWDIICRNFSSLIRKNTINSVAELVECNFSTTGGIEKMVSQVSLMYTCEKYFNYRLGKCGCGIQKVHFLGVEKDWLDLKEKLLNLKKYALDYDNNSRYEFESKLFTDWVGALAKILENFIKTYQGEPNVAFWNSIIQQFEGYEMIRGPSGNIKGYSLSDFINGWILDFFLFDSQRNYMSRKLEDIPLEKPDNKVWKLIKGNSNIKTKNGIKIKNIPIGVWKAPVLIQYCYGPKKGETMGVNFIGGFSAVAQEGCVYRPQVTFAVGERIKTDEEITFEPIF